jgi:hypothetical protein
MLRRLPISACLVESPCMPAQIFFRTRTSIVSSLFIAAPAFLFALALSGCVSSTFPRQQSVPALLPGTPGVAVYAAGDIADCR